MYNQFHTLNTQLIIAFLNLIKDIFTALIMRNNVLQLHMNFLYQF
jgi:hypothetical protein